MELKKVDNFFFLLKNKTVIIFILRKIRKLTVSEENWEKEKNHLPNYKKLMSEFLKPKLIYNELAQFLGKFVSFNLKKITIDIKTSYISVYFMRMIFSVRFRWLKR